MTGESHSARGESMRRVSVVGLGKLGACIAACLASRGYEVIGVDTNPERVAQLNRGQAPVFEPGLQALLDEVKDRLRATQDCGEAVVLTDATFIVVPTPSADDGGFSLAHVRDAARAIGTALRQKSEYHLVVLTSTVLPGATGREILPLLEQASQKHAGEEFGLCYSPEFVALGSVIRDLLRPDFVLIGESDPRAGDCLAAIYHRICGPDIHIARMNLVNAELTKIAVNTFVTTKITYANMLAAICERLPGGDVDVVTNALGFDSRIGPKYLKGALGYGGPCFPRDNLAFAAFARDLGLSMPIAEATDASNRQIPRRVVDVIIRHVPERGKIAILGLAYKPGTNVVEESQSLVVAEELVTKGFSVVVYDPLATEPARAALSDRVRYAATIRECLRDVEAIVLATPDETFQVVADEIYAARSNTVVVDVWRRFRALENHPYVKYVAVGAGEGSQLSAPTARP